jgi:hypothetical protein
MKKLKNQSIKRKHREMYQDIAMDKDFLDKTPKPQGKKKQK